MHGAVTAHDKGTRFDDLVGLFQAYVLMRRLRDKTSLKLVKKDI